MSVASFAIIFSHSEGCLFTILIISIVVQKFLSLTRSHLFIFVFMSIILGSNQRRSSGDLCQRVFCLFSSKSFILSGGTFKSLNPLLSLFLCMVL